MPGVTNVRIAMWSGPRNISTAAMRAWENRPDTAVWDEPLYGHYLEKTGIDHPMREDVIASMETDWRKVTAQLTGPIPEGKAIHYQKHMTHHLLDHIGRDWMDGVTSCFLIRDPAEVIASYAVKRDEVTLADIGVERQAEIFDYVCRRTGKTPPVLDSRDVLTHPEAMMKLLCEAVEVPFDERMLSWPAGRRDSDGIWGKHWYHAVEASTGFAPYKPSQPLEGELAKMAESCRPQYLALYERRLRPED